MMEPQELASILMAFGLKPPTLEIKSLAGGLINNTWLLAGSGEDFILQRVNDLIFPDPEKIDQNITAIACYLKKKYPDYLFIAPIRTLQGAGIYFLKDAGYFRIFPFVKGSHTISEVKNIAQAREASNQFGLFTKNLSGFPYNELHPVLPHFHDLELRYTSFIHALKGANAERIEKSSRWIDAIEDQKCIVDTYIQIKKDPQFKLRVTHHDTKISNVLFDVQGKGICVIDLDTVMAGYFISDLGDMFRTYLSPVNEEEKDFTRIEVRIDFFKAIVQGYLFHMGNELTQSERQSLVYAGKFGVYMQAIRFLTDYLRNDIYYGSSYPEQNLMRAANQLTLLQKLIDKDNQLTKIQNFTRN